MDSTEVLLESFVETQLKLKILHSSKSIYLKDMESLNFDFFSSDSVAYRAIESYDENLLQETKLRIKKYKFYL